MKRNAYSLLELMLALALTVLATALIGSLMQLYANNFAVRGEDIRRAALARSLLNMIADDLRSTVMKQELDTSVLQQMLVGQSGGSAMAGAGGAGAQAGQTGLGGQAAGGGGQGGTGQGGNNQNNSNQGNTQTGGSSQAQSGGNQNKSSQGQSATGGSSSSGGGTSSGTSSTGQSGSGATSGSQSGSGTSGQTSTSTPLGVYGSQYQLTLDISRLPRPDEYFAQQNSMLTGSLGDVPGDIKNVSYYVQMPTQTGVSDSMSNIASTSTDGGTPGGLVRRQIDRNVLAYAEEQGQSLQLQRTGDLVAPEVIELNFSYYDGLQWTTSWDSSSQSLPQLVDISIAIQSASGEKNGLVPPGTSISMMPVDEQTRLGIQVYNLIVAIPGAQLQANTAESADQAEGMQSLGL